MSGSRRSEKWTRGIVRSAPPRCGRSDVRASRGDRVAAARRAKSRRPCARAAAREPRELGDASLEPPASDGGTRKTCAPRPPTRAYRQNASARGRMTRRERRPGRGSIGDPVRVRTRPARPASLSCPEAGQERQGNEEGTAGVGGSEWRQRSDRGSAGRMGATGHGASGARERRGLGGSAAKNLRIERLRSARKLATPTSPAPVSAWRRARPPASRRAVD